MLNLIHPTKLMVISFVVIGGIGLLLDAVGKVYEIATADKHAAQTGVYIAKTLMGDENIDELLVNKKKKFNKKNVINAEVKDAK